MKRLGMLVAFVLLGAAWAQAQEVPLRKTPETPQAIEAGKKLYIKRCGFCHGDGGGGDGPVADYLYPRPRNFKLGQYKFRTTPSGERPTDEDLVRAITRGIPGTAMPSWELLKEEERWQLVYYLKSLSEEAWPKPGPQPIKFGQEVRASASVIARGKEVYDKAKCWECHGQQGRGDGPAAPTLKDDQGFPIKAFDLTKSWLFKGGNDARDIFTRFSTGVDGTPMPSYADSLSEQERWQMAHYVQTLQTAAAPGLEVVLKAHRIKEALPLDANHPAWRKATPLVVSLSGQVFIRPRWQVPAVDTVEVRALFNEKTVGFLLVWDDPFKDTVHKEEGEKGDELTKFPYVKLDPARGRYQNLRDSVALQFPVVLPEGPARPHFVRGSAGQPVILWQWKADWQEASEGKSPAEEFNAEGVKKPYLARPAQSQEVMAKGLWTQGQWKVVMIRNLQPKDKNKNLAFPQGKLIPFAIQTWEGSNGERGLLMALSSWYFLLLPKSVPWLVYLYSFAGFLVVGGLEWWLVRQMGQG